MGIRSARWGLLAALAAGACAQVPTGSSGPASDRLPDKAFFVDKENMLDGELYPGRIEADRPVYRLSAVGALAITAATADSSLAGFAPARAIDGDATTQWASGVYRPATAWLQVQLGITTTISSIRVKMRPLAGAATYDIQVSSDGASWTTVAAGQKNTSWNLETKSFPARSGNRVRLFFRNDAARSMERFSTFELQVFGEQGAGATPSPAPSPTPSTDASRYYPDLRAVAPGRLIMTSENGRRYVRFDNLIPNVGNGHFQVRAVNENGVTRAFQEILDSSGRVVASVFVGSFEYHPTHNHFHIADVALYQLRSASATGPLLRQGYKVSYCLLDSLRFLSDAGPSLYGGCNQVMQGVARGWADLYDRTLPGQEIDVTGYPAGTYYIVTLVDPTNKFVDPNRGNETAWTKFYMNPATGALTVQARSSP